jgi:hypothetical protein
MKRMRALVVPLVTAILAGCAGAPAGTAGDARRARDDTTRAGREYELTVDAPPPLRKGEVAVLVLHVRHAGRPVDAAPTCLAPVPLFVSAEDALDPTPAGGMDLGPGEAQGSAAGCNTAIAGERVEPGTYAFTWEPDTAGRVNLSFVAGGTTLMVPVDVASAPPSRAVLILFLLAVATILIVAAALRRHHPPLEHRT